MVYWVSLGPTTRQVGFFSSKVLWCYQLGLHSSRSFRKILNELMGVNEESRFDPLDGTLQFMLVMAVNALGNSCLCIYFLSHSIPYRDAS